MPGRYIHCSAGNGGVIGGHPTAKFQVRGTDLGFLFVGGKGQWVGGLFGDTYNAEHPLDPNPNKDWRSPVMGRTSNRDFLTRGIYWDNFAGSPNTGGRAKQIYPYRHIGENGTINGQNFDAFTIIPNDAIQLPDGHYMGMSFRVKDWKSDDGQAMCHTISNAWFHSWEPHADSWEPAWDVERRRLLEWDKNDPRDRFFQNASFLMVPGDDNVYVFGSREGRKIGTGGEADGVWLRRCHWQHLWERSAWEYWGWTGSRWEWGKHVMPTPILKPVTPGQCIGELNAQYIGGKVVLTYSDAVLGAVALTADRPDSIWSAPVVMVNRIQEPAQYAPSVHPWSTDLSNAYVHISSWLKAPGDVTVNYCTKGYRASLVAQAPSWFNVNAISLKSEVLAPDTAAMTTAERETFIADIQAASAEASRAV